MSTRADIVTLAVSQDGYHDGQGYDEVNKYAQAYGINYGIAYCDIFVAWCYELAGIPLPRMNEVGVALTSGAQYCPDSWAYAQAHGATRASYLASPGDQAIFDWTGTGVLGGESHTEIVERWANGVLYTVGGNSGPSNVDGYKGLGGVHRHAWSCPAGVGNDLIMGVIDTSKLVTFSTTEEFVMDAEAKQAFAALTAKLDQMIQIIEGGIDPKKNPYGIVGTRDLQADLKKIATHIGVQL